LGNHHFASDSVTAKELNDYEKNNRHIVPHRGAMHGGISGQQHPAQLRTTGAGAGKPPNPSGFQLSKVDGAG